MLTDNSDSTKQSSWFSLAMDAIQAILSATSREEALLSVARSICSVLGSDVSAAITLVDSKGRLNAESRYVSGPLTNLLRKRGPRKNGLTAWVVQNRQSIYEPDVQQHESSEHPYVRTKLAPVGAYACLPLEHDKQVFGALFVAFGQAFTFDEDALKALEAMASLATRAIEVTEQLRRSQTQAAIQAQTYRRFSEQLRTIWEQPQPDEALENTLNEILRRVEEEVLPDSDASASIYIYEEGEGFHSGATGGPLRKYMKAIPPREGGTAMHALQTGIPLFVDDVSQLSEGEIPRLHPEAEHYGVQAFANLPLIMGEGNSETIVGILIINLRKSFTFSKDIQNLLTIFADEAAIALQSARVFRRRLREQQALQHISELAIAANQEKTADEIARLAANLSNSAYATLWSVDPACTTLTLAGHYIESHPDWTPPKQLLTIGADSLSGLAASEGKPKYIDNISDKNSPHFENWHKGCTAAFAVPLNAAGQIVGVLYIATDRPNGIDPKHQEFIRQLASHAAISLYSARLTEEKQSFFRRISQFQHNVANVLSLRDQVIQIREELGNIGIDTSGLFVATYNQNTERIELPEVYENGVEVSDDKKTPGTTYGPRQFGDRNGLIDWMLRRQPPVSLLIENFETWPHRDEIDADYRHNIKSFVAAPMLRNGEVAGFIGLRSYNAEGLYDESHRQIFEELANYVAVIIENAQKHDQQIAGLRAVSDFQQRISGLETEERTRLTIYEEIGTTVQKLADITNLYVAEFNQSTGEITFPVVISEGKAVEERSGIWAPRELGSHRGLTDYIIETGDPLQIPNKLGEWIDEQAQADKVTMQYKSPTKCYLGVPIKDGDKVTGVIAIQNDVMEDVFEEQHQDLLGIIASHAAVALENARQYDLIHHQLKRRIDALTAINEFQAQISRPVSLQDELDSIYKAAKKALSGLVDTRNMYVALYDESSRMIHFPLAYENGKRIPESEKKFGTPYGPRVLGTRRGLTDWLIRHKHPLLIENNFDKWAAEQDDIKAFPMGTKCWLGAPMMRGQRVIGVIGLQNFEREKVFNQNHERLLTIIAGQAAIAIDNAAQYSLREAELKAVSQFQQEIGSVDSVETELEQVYNAAHKSLKELMNTRNMYVALYDESSREIHFPLVYENGKRIPESEKKPDEPWAPRTLGSRGGLTEWIIKRKRSLLIEKDFDKWIAEQDAIKVFPIRTKCWLGAPMMRGQRVIGVIGLQNFERENVFNQRHKQLLATIASQTAVAIENARMAEEARRRRLSLIPQISQKIATVSYDLNSLLELIGRAANDVCDSDLTSVYLYDRHTGGFTRGVRVEPNQKVIEYQPAELPDPDGVAAFVAHMQKAKYQPRDAKKQKFSRRYDFEAFAALPLVVSTVEGIPTTVGVFFVNFKQSHEFSENEKEILEHLANLAATAIDYSSVKESLMASEQLSALGAAMATLQHRLGNTIGITLPAVMRLRHRLKDDPEALNVLDTIERNTLYATEVIRRMQTPLEHEDFDRTEVNSLLNQAIQQCIKSAKDRYPEIVIISDIISTNNPEVASESTNIIKVTTNFDSELPKTYARIGQITEVFRVLVENGIKAIAPESGFVTINTRLDKTQIKPQIEIIITDTGRGMDEKTRMKIFKQPVPRKEFGQGAGLGLWLSYIMVRSHQGQIGLESTEPGKGSSFRVSLPVLTEAPSVIV